MLMENRATKLGLLAHKRKLPRQPRRKRAITRTRVEDDRLTTGVDNLDIF
jgi:hypothetical protein